jgi:hypothetical protein
MWMASVYATCTGDFIPGLEWVETATVGILDNGLATEGYLRV